MHTTRTGQFSSGAFTPKPEPGANPVVPEPLSPLRFAVVASDSQANATRTMCFHEMEISHHSGSLALRHAPANASRTLDFRRPACRQPAGESNQKRSRHRPHGASGDPAGAGDRHPGNVLRYTAGKKIAARGGKCCRNPYGVVRPTVSHTSRR